MRRGAGTLIVVSILAIHAAHADAEVYRWVDANGQLHFSQSLDQVPAGKRRGAVEAAQNDAATGLDPLQRFDVNDSVPARMAPPSYAGQGATRVPFERQGTLMKVVAKLNGRVDVPFYVDTGASGISLPAEYLKPLGIRVDGNTPRMEIRTASGTIAEPVVEIGSVELGGVRVEGLQATVSSVMPIGLLGGTFFNQFVYGVDAAQGVITLERNEGMRGGLREAEWRERFRGARTPLSELETYLAAKEFSRPGRLTQLLEHRGRLREELRVLETEARRAGVPAAWRE